jgi:hypothetical protein
MSDIFNYVIDNGPAIAAIISAAYALFGAVAHFTKNEEDDRIYDKLAKPVSVVISFLSKKKV